MKPTVSMFTYSGKKGVFQPKRACAGSYLYYNIFYNMAYLQSNDGRIHVTK